MWLKTTETIADYNRVCMVGQNTKQVWNKHRKQKKWTESEFIQLYWILVLWYSGLRRLETVNREAGYMPERKWEYPKKTRSENGQTLLLWSNNESNNTNVLPQRQKDCLLPGLLWNKEKTTWEIFIYSTLNFQLSIEQPVHKLWTLASDKLKPKGCCIENKYTIETL